MEKSGYIEVSGGRVWYGIHGDGPGLPVLCLHGGPGLPHGYISCLEDLSTTRTVIFYDQLGCGRSERPDDTSLWTVDRAVDELNEVRAALGIDAHHLFGSSWGGMLALQYALESDVSGIQSLTIASGPATISAWMDHAHRLREQLPEDVKSVIDSHYLRGRFHCPEFVGAVAAYYRRHLCRMDPWPEGLEEAFEGLGAQVYESMWGATEFGPCTGVLRDFDILPRLGAIDIPTLLTIGRYDECPLDHYEDMHAAMSKSELVVFEEGSHMHFFEERDRYMAVMEHFLRRAEEGLFERSRDRPVS